MEIRSYNSELAVANLCFKRIFNNIQIERTDRKGNKKLIPVICTFDQRSRIVKNWENSEKRANMSLPMIAINRTGYSRASDRLNNYNNEVKYEVLSNDRKYDLLTPVPIDVSYDVSIIAAYPSDIDQIASNFLVMLNNDAYANCMHPKYDGLMMHNQIVLQDSITEEHPNELDAAADDIITATFQFVFKTYLFGGTQRYSCKPSQIISSQLSTVLSTFPYEFKAYELSSLSSQLADYPNTTLSVLSSVTITTEVTSWIDNPDGGDDVYDIVPIIKQLNVGFYPTPYLSTHEAYMAEVDAMPLSARDFYRDLVIWKIDEMQLSST